MTGSPLRRGMRRLQVALPEPIYRLLQRAQHIMANARRSGRIAERVRGTALRTGRSMTLLKSGLASTIDYLVAGIIAEPAITADRGLHMTDAWQSAVDMLDDVDLVLVQCPRQSAAREADDFFRIPTAVRCTADLSDMEGSDEFRKTTKRIAKYGLRPFVSHDTSDFSRFYDEAYRPHVAARFGALSRPHSRIHLQRCFRRGGLLWVLRRNTPCAGMLYTIRGDTAYIHVSAPLLSEPDAVRIGALSAARKFLLDLARTEGCRILDMGTARPNLLDGVLRHKKQWGARIVDDTDDDTEIRLKWPAFHAEIADWLHTMPLVFRDGDELGALTALPPTVSPRELRQHLDRIAVPGLRRIHVIGRPEDGTGQESARGVDVCWRDPVPREDLATSR